MPSPQMLNATQFAVPPQVVWTNRIIWAAMLLGQVMFAVIIDVVSNGPRRPSNDTPTGLFVGVDAALLVVALVVTAAVRSYGMRGVGDVRALRGRYGLGVIFPMAFLEGASFFGLVIVFLTHRWTPAVIVPAVAIATQVSLFPRARVSVSNDFRDN